MDPGKVSNYSSTERQEGFGNPNYAATTTRSVTLSIDATRTVDKRVLHLARECSQTLPRQPIHPAIPTAWHGGLRGFATQVPDRSDPDVAEEPSVLHML